jgi:hypothetical protein
VLRPIFYSSYRNEEIVRYRQAVFSDLECPETFKLFPTFNEAMRSVRGNLDYSEKIDGPSHKHTVFLRAVQLYCEGVDALLGGLRSVSPQSEGLRNILAYLKHYAGSSEFRTLSSETAELRSSLSNLRYGMLFRGDMVTVRKYAAEPDYTATILERFAKFREANVQPPAAQLKPVDDSGLNHVEEAILEFVSQLFPEQFRRLDQYAQRHGDFIDDTIARFDREIGFYVSYLGFIRPLKDGAGLPFCHPQVSVSSKETNVEGGFDLALAAKLFQEKHTIVRNDFRLSGKERLLVFRDQIKAARPRVMAAAFAHAWTNDIETIRYRQAVLSDCIANPALVRQFYAIAIEPFTRDRSWDYSLFGRDASSKVSSGVRTLQNSLDLLTRLRKACTMNADRFTSPGFRQFFATLESNLDDNYLEAARTDLSNLTFRSGLLLSAQVGDGGRGVGTTLRVPQPRDLSWIRRVLTPGARSFTYQLAPRDEAGARAFGELQGRGLSLISDAVYESAEHVLNFIKALRAELAFYLGCLNIKDHLDRIGEPVCYPEPHDAQARFRCRNLRDVCLALTMGRPVVGNDVDGNGKPLIIITGANRGGKSTFLRSVGLAQLMLQCGLFVTADALSASLHSGLFTHYKREEDRNMSSGKFDEELVRMNAIAEQIHRSALILFNESFAATHEREGSEIARQIVSALLENNVTVFFVSHMYEFSRSFLEDERVLFLRADRGEDGARSFRLVTAKPLPSSFGADLYERIFGMGAGEHVQAQL